MGINYTDAITLETVEKSFKNVPVLKGVSLSVKQGSIFALLGSNGAGKTTVIKILSTLMSPDRGRAMVSGYDVMNEPDKVREEISLTGQFAAVDEALTGRDNLCLIGALRHLSDVNGTVNQLLAQFGLKDASNRKVSTYSGGMRRRLDIAMSIMGNPSVIFLDEPTTGLDPQNRSAMWKIVKSLADNGTTIFLTTQYLEEAEKLADRIAVLNDGMIVAEGSPEELKKILPQGVIELALQNEQDSNALKDLLHDFTSKQNDEMLSLSVVTDGSIEQLTDILDRIRKSGIPISGFTQKLPTLEDAFYILIGEKQGGFVL